MDLTLRTLQVTDFKSIQKLELSLGAVHVLVGKNDVGKSNVLGILELLRRSHSSLNDHEHPVRDDTALASYRRDGDLKRPISLELVFDVGTELRRAAVACLEHDNPEMFSKEWLSTEFATTLRYTMEWGLHERRAAIRHQLFLAVSGVRGGVALVDAEIREGKSETISADVQAIVGSLHQSVRFRPDLSRRSSGSFDPIGRPSDIVEGSEGFVDRFMLAIHAWMAGRCSVAPVRSTEPRTSIAGVGVLDPTGRNLTDVLHGLRNNAPSKFAEIEAGVRAIVPLRGPLLTPTSAATVTVAVDHDTSRFRVELDHFSSGLRSVLTIVTHVVLAPPGSFVTIEEPEAHLHPAAQQGLVDFLRRASKTKQILVVTHSPVVAAGVPLGAVTLLRRGEHGYTTGQPVSHETLPKVIEELGLRPSYGFEAETVLFVEGRYDVPIYSAWLEKLGLMDQFEVIGGSGWTSLATFANAQLLRSRRLKVKACVIIDGDANDEKRASQREPLLRALDLAEDRILILDVAEVEAHLADADAIASLYPRLGDRVEELRAWIAGTRARRDQKKVLRELYAEFDLGEYEHKEDLRMARALDAVPTEIAEFLQRVAEA